MKISNREKIMLFVLGIILIGFGYFNFIYLGQTAKIQEKLKEESEVKEKYETAKATIDSLEAKKSDEDLLKAKITSESQPFYPIINEEHIILEIDKMLTDSGLKGAIKFDPIVCDSVENEDKKSTSLAESTLQQTVDKYKSKETLSNNSNSQNNNADKGNASDNKNSSNSNESKDKKDTVQYVKFQISFSGTYEDIYNFISAIGQNDRKIVINAVQLNSDTLKGMKGTINLEIYSVPKIDDDLENYLQWDLNNNYGKSTPFAEGTSDKTSNTINSTITKADKTAQSADFLASVKSITSDLPKIIIGKAKDDLRTTYVYGDSNSEENAEMVFEQDGDKYYYKYKTSKGAFPSNYEGIGEEFIPISDDIVVNVMSQLRASADDNSAMKLKIINKTDKTVDVNITGDDSTNPRVTIDADNSNVKVNKS